VGILEDKTNAIVAELIDSELLQFSDRFHARRVVMEQLQRGGSYQLLEDAAGTIHAKSIVRDDSGDISGMQG